LQATPSTEAILPCWRRPPGIFYIYKEKIFLKNILGVEVKNGGGDIHIKIESIDNMTQISRLPTFAELLQTFPRNKCGSRGARKSVLTHDASSDAVAWMHDMVKLMLEGRLEFFSQQS
jgi:hypothetical protein